MYNLYITPEEMKNDTILIQHTAVGDDKEQYLMPYMTLVYAAHGKGWHYIDNAYVEFNEGDVALIHSDVSNCFYTNEAKLGGLSMYIGVFSEKFFTSITSKCQKEFKQLDMFFTGECPCIYVHDTKQKDLRNMFIKMLDEVTYTKQGYKEKLTALMKTELIDFFRLYSIGYMGETHLYSNKIMGELVNYINRNIYSRLSLKDTANILHITPQHLCRVFKKHMKMTFTDYVNHKRVELIKDELEHTDRPIFVIYDDFELTGAYLNEIFKKQTGYTMAEYKEKFNYKKGNPLYYSQTELSDKQ